MQNINQYEHVKPLLVPYGDRTMEVYNSANYHTLTQVILQQIKDAGYTSIIGIARGGLPIVALLQKYGKGILPDNIKFGALHASSYTGEQQSKIIYVADRISLYGGGGLGDKPLLVDDMLDSGNSKKAIDNNFASHNLPKPKWAVAIQKEHSTEDADHVGQGASNNWAKQPHENWYDQMGHNIAKIGSTGVNLDISSNEFDFLYGFAEALSLHIFKNMQSELPTDIIGTGSILSAHLAAMVSRILCCPSGTHLSGGELSFVNPSHSTSKNLGDNPWQVSIPHGMDNRAMVLAIRTGSEMNLILSNYKQG